MDRTGEIVKVSVRGVLVNVALAAFKAFVGLVSHSIAVLLDAVNNLSDALSSVLTIVGAKLAARSPDRNHPYGYGRVEYLTSTVIAFIVLAAGTTSMKESIEKILRPEAPSYSALSIAIIAVAIAVKLLLGRYFTSKGKQLNASSLTASGADATMDAVVSSATLVSALINLAFGLNLEGWLGAIISVFILKAGWEVLTDTMNRLIGVRTDEELSKTVKEKLCEYPEILGAYDLILHAYGPEENIGSVHVEVADEMTALEFDRLTRKVVPEIYLSTGVILTLGLYASNAADDASRTMREEAERVIATEGTILQMHGFYVDHGQRRVSLDIIVDFNDPDRMAVCRRVRDALKERWKDYDVHVNLDRDFSD